MDSAPTSSGSTAYTDGLRSLRVCWEWQSLVPGQMGAAHEAQWEPILDPSDPNYVSKAKKTTNALNINEAFRTIIMLHDGIEQRAQESISQDAVGGRLSSNLKPEDMTSDDMHRHLQQIQKLVVRWHRMPLGDPRMWIDTILCRASAMVKSSSHRVVVNTGSELPLPDAHLPINTTAVDYVCTLVPEKDYEDFMQSRLRYQVTWAGSRAGMGLVITESKVASELMYEQIPEAIVPMYAYAKNFGQKIVRGVYTNGYCWVFLVLYLNENGGGHWIQGDVPRNISSHLHDLDVGMDIIAGIISHWVQHGAEDIGEDDWFKVVVL